MNRRVTDWLHGFADGNVSRGRLWLWPGRVLIVCLLGLAAVRPAPALTISTTFVPADEEFGFGLAEKARIGSASPKTFPPVLGGSYAAMNEALKLSVEKAAQWWRAAIQDDFQLEIRYGWSNDVSPSAIADMNSRERIDYLAAAAVHHRTKKAVIRFSDQPNIDWFIDHNPVSTRNQFFQSVPGPFDPNFNPGVEGNINIADDLFHGPAVMVNGHREASAADGPAKDRIDLFTVALHEIGHALGVDTQTQAGSLQFARFVSADGGEVGPYLQSGLQSGNVVVH